MTWNLLMSQETITTGSATTLELYRRARGLGREQLSVLAGVNRETIARWERRENNPRLATARAVAAALEVPVDALFPPTGQGAS